MTVLYAEVPGFYAEIERAAHPELRGRAVLVGGDPRKNGTVQSATPEALAAGVVTGMRVLEALERCPRARRFRTDMRRYREVSARLRTVLRRSVEHLEPAGLGAAYLDARAVTRPVEELARELVKAVETELSLPLRVGIAASKLLARLAAEEAASGVGCVEPGAERAFLGPLAVERLPGVGPATAGRLAELGARTVGELAGLERSRVQSALGVHGRTLWELAQGRDLSRVRPAPLRKSLSQEASFRPEERDSTAILARLSSLAEGLATALARESLRARKVTLKVRYADQERVTRSCTVEPAVTAPAEIHARAAMLLARTQAGARAVRGIGIVLGGLALAAHEDRQLDLFGPRD